MDDVYYTWSWFYEVVDAAVNMKRVTVCHFGDFLGTILSLIRDPGLDCWKIARGSTSSKNDQFPEWKNTGS